MNKKLLICGIIASGLFLTACVKKEAPKEEEQQQVDQQAEAASEPAQFEPLDSVEPVTGSETTIPEHVEVERHETEHTTTEVRREIREAPQAEIAPKPEVSTQRTETPKVENKPAQVVQPKQNNTAQTEDDAVAAAIAAATPALEN